MPPVIHLRKEGRSFGVQYIGNSSGAAAAAAAAATASADAVSRRSNEEEQRRQQQQRHQQRQASSAAAAVTGAARRSCCIPIYSIVGQENPWLVRPRGLRVGGGKVGKQVGKRKFQRT